MSPIIGIFATLICYLLDDIKIGVSEATSAEAVRALSFTISKCNRLQQQLITLFGC